MQIYPTQILDPIRILPPAVAHEHTWYWPNLLAPAEVKKVEWREHTTRRPEECLRTSQLSTRGGTGPWSRLLNNSSYSWYQWHCNMGMGHKVSYTCILGMGLSWASTTAPTEWGQLRRRIYIYITLHSNEHKYIYKWPQTHLWVQWVAQRETSPRAQRGWRPQRGMSLQTFSAPCRNANSERERERWRVGKALHSTTAL